MIHCLMFVINLGMRSGGGIGDALEQISYQNDSQLFYGRFFFDLSFFILIIIILLNIIFGIIIDTFAELRDEK
jgi:hypothetical protein